MLKLESIPEVGKEYNFFDDGKISPSRHHKAKVLRVVPYDEEVIVNRFDYDLDQLVPTTLQSIHKEAVDAHRQGEYVTILNVGAGTLLGDPWLYAEETDYFIECSIPGYDDNNIWFARTVDGGWFSMDIQSSWQAGRLDVDNSIKLTWE